MPEYAIKVLERLHHIFVDINNVIVIVSMDKKQLSHSIQEIYGTIEVDTYLRKFISFKVNLKKGVANRYFDKYVSYVSMFEVTALEKEEIEEFFTDIMSDLNMREQERIFNKAEVIHRLIRDDAIKDCSIMTFEILFLTCALSFKRHDIKWIVNKSIHMRLEGEKAVLKGKIESYEKELCQNGRSYNGLHSVQERWQEKTFFWIASIYFNYVRGECGPYYYNKQAETRIGIIKRFMEFIDIIDDD